MSGTSAATGAGENPLATFWLEAKKEWERRFYEAQAENERMHRAVPDEFCLDPPDGGDVKPWEAVQRMADALAALREENGRVRLANLDCVDHFNQMKDELAASRQREEELRKALIYASRNMNVFADYSPVVKALGYASYAEMQAALSEKPAAEKEVGAESRDPMEDSQWWDDSDMGAR